MLPDLPDEYALAGPRCRSLSPAANREAVRSSEDPGPSDDPLKQLPVADRGGNRHPGRSAAGGAGVFRIRPGQPSGTSERGRDGLAGGPSRWVCQASLIRSCQ